MPPGLALRPLRVRDRASGSPTIRASPTSTCTGSPRSPRVGLHAVRGETPVWLSIECSLSRSLCLAGLIVHHRNEQVGNAGRTHVPKRGELLMIDSIEYHDAATLRLAFVHRLKRPRSCDLLGMHDHFQVARLQLFHAASENDAAAIDEHDIGEDVLNLFHLMCCHYDRAIAIEVVI